MFPTFTSFYSRLCGKQPNNRKLTSFHAKRDDEKSILFFWRHLGSRACADQPVTHGRTIALGALWPTSSRRAHRLLQSRLFLGSFRRSSVFDWGVNKSNLQALLCAHRWFQSSPSSFLDSSNPTTARILSRCNCKHCLASYVVPRGYGDALLVSLCFGLSQTTQRTSHSSIHSCRHHVAENNYNEREAHRKYNY